MKTFFASKYSVIIGYEKDNGRVKLPVGTIFTIDGIASNFFELIPIEKTTAVKNPLMVDAAMLSIGFTQQETIE